VKFSTTKKRDIKYKKGKKRKVCMEPFVHALIPLAFLLALFPNLDKKYIFTLVPIVWIIDLDSYIGIHRFTFHNLFFVLALACIAYVIWRNRYAFWVAFYYGFSHLFLDFAMPGPAWFYPIIQKTIYLQATIQRKGEWLLSFSLGSLNKEQYTAFVQTVGPTQYIGEHSILFLALFTILLMIKWRKEIRTIFKKKK